VKGIKKSGKKLYNILKLNFKTLLQKGSNFMKKAVVIIFTILGIIFELAAIIYTINMRGEVAFGSEYGIMPMCIVLGYISAEIISRIKQRKH